jgi:oxygen-dependent protoporphyrinogen oxidase
MPQVIVVGGGLAGLAAAYELHRREAEFLLLEASSRLGGVLRTDYVGDLVIDAGPDALLARKPAGIELCEELGIADRLVPTRPPRTAFVLRGGQLRPLTPPAPTLEDDGSGPEAQEPDTALPDESIASFFRRRFGEDAVRDYAEPALAGIHAGDVDRLSIRALFPEMLGNTPPARTPDPRGLFRSFPRGMQELVDALIAALPADRIRLDSPIAQLSGEGTRWIIATPAHQAARILHGSDSELAALCRAIPYVSSAIAVLAYTRAAVQHPLAGSGFVVPRVERSPILAATWLSSKWPGRAPSDVALMRAFFGGARDPEAVARTDDELVLMAHGELSALLGIAGPPSFSRVYRWIDGTPQYEVGYLARLATIRERAARHRVQLIGAGFGSIGIPDCIAAGREAARVALI